MILRKILFAACVAGTLLFFSMDMQQKETLLKNGRLVYFDMQQRDPRSLMQGDYMRLNYAIHRDMMRAESIPEKGYLVISPDSQQVARFVRLDEARAPQHDSEMAVQYRLKGKKTWHEPVTGPSSYFFEEGKAECFSTARYIGLRIGEDGEVLLDGLYDWDFCRLREMDLADYAAWLAAHPAPPPPPPNARD